MANPTPTNPKPNAQPIGAKPAGGVAVAAKPGAQVNGQPPEAESEPLVPIEPDMWQRYSSHHEFPLSAITSVVLHFLVTLVVAVFGMMIFNWSSSNDVPELDNVEFAGGGGEGGGAGDPNAHEMTGEAITFNPDDTPVEFDTTDIASPTEITQDTQIIDAAKKVDRMFKGERKSGLGGDVGLGGTGTGGGRGRGHGRGIGDGIGDGKQTKRSKRMDRWLITFSYKNGEEYLQRLGNLNAVLVISEGLGKYKMIEDLNKRPIQAVQKTEADVKALNRIFWIQDDKEAMEVLKATLSLSGTPKYVWAFFPRDLEDALLKKELEKSKLTEDQLNEGNWKTTFTVERSAGKWDVRIESQKKEPRKR